MTKEDFMTIVPRCKCILLGESNTGKTSIVQRFLDPNQSFNKKYNMTTGVTISSKQIKINNKSSNLTNNSQNILNNLNNITQPNKLNKVVSFEDEDEENLEDNIIELYIYDISGKPIYFDLLKNICNNVSMVIGVFDVCKIDTFKRLQNLLNDLMKQFQVTNSKNSSITDSNSNKSTVIGVILGNKCDLERRVVDEQEAKKFTKKYANFAYFDCSAKNNFNIVEVFTFLSTKFIEQINE